MCVFLCACVSVFDYVCVCVCVCVFVCVCMWSVGKWILLRYYEGKNEEFIIQLFFPYLRLFDRYEVLDSSLPRTFLQ